MRARELAARVAFAGVRRTRVRARHRGDAKACTLDAKMAKKSAPAQEPDLGQSLRVRLYAVTQLSPTDRSTPRQKAIFQLLCLLSKRWELPKADVGGPEESEGWRALRASARKRDDLTAARGARARAAATALRALETYVATTKSGGSPSPHEPTQFGTWRDEERQAVERVLGILRATTTKTPLRDAVEWALHKPSKPPSGLPFEWQEILCREGITCRELGLLALCAGYWPNSTMSAQDFDDKKVVELAAKAARQEAKKLDPAFYRKLKADARQRKPTA